MKVEVDEMRKIDRLQKTDGLRHRVIVKILAFIIMLIAVSTFIVSVTTGVFMVENKGYLKTKEEFIDEFVEERVLTRGYHFMQLLVEGNTEYLEEYCKNESNLEFAVKNGDTSYETSGVASLDSETTKIYTQTVNLNEFHSEYFIEYETRSYSKDIIDILGISDEMVVLNLKLNQYDESSYYSSEVQQIINEELNISVEVTTYLDTNYVITDEFSFYNQVLDLVYGMKGFVWGIVALSGIVSIAFFVFLVLAAGYRRGYEKPIVCGTAKAPLDLLAMICAVPGTLCILMGYGVARWLFEGYGYENSEVYAVIGTVLAIALGVVVMVLFIMDITVRLRTRTLISNNLIVILWKKLAIFGRITSLIKTCQNKVIEVIGILPMMWKGLLLYGIVSIMVFISLQPYSVYTRMFFWICINIIVLPILLKVYLMFCRLQEGSTALGKGDLSYVIDENKLLWEFKEMGRNMNSIAEGMEGALREKMKSERLKTELISNVSHDIKTPLTSIINYADLIGKEETDNEKIHEYSEILLRQAERLKKLTEDLVHASKVTTGNVEVQLAPCDVGVLLTQMIGEYEHKLETLHLKMIVKQPEQPVVIQADGKHMWRIFDNLLNNVCKYAQEGTRIYLSLEEKELQAVISLRNISKYELNISEEELMERFVRGDSSRHSEGNGLGLSIAKSLVEVQGGSMQIVIDGDLFKVILQFPKYLFP
ncbi:MAG: HAMP domain-containing sensor histidine kinase [Eubacteriales bacterium]